MTAAEARMWVLAQTRDALRRHAEKPELLTKNLKFSGSPGDRRKVCHQMRKLADFLEKKRVRAMVHQATLEHQKGNDGERPGGGGVQPTPA